MDSNQPEDSQNYHKEMQFHYKDTQNDLKRITNVSHHKDTHSGQKETKTEIR